MSKAVSLGQREVELFDLAARYCGILAAVERAHAIGSDEEVVSLLAGVDPIDLREVQNDLRAFLRFLEILPHQSRGGSTEAPSRDSTVAPVPPTTARTDGSVPRPTAPSNVRALDDWSVRCA